MGSDIWIGFGQPAQEIENELRDIASGKKLGFRDEAHKADVVRQLWDDLDKIQRCFPETYHGVGDPRNSWHPTGLVRP
jgi:hypothetical protein